MPREGAVPGSLEFKDIANRLDEMGKAFADLTRLLDVEKKRGLIKEKEKAASGSDFWNDTQKAQGHLKELSELKDSIFLEMREKGLIPIIYAHLYSAFHWSQLASLVAPNE